MSKISSFRGYSGETVRLFARIGTLITVIPALLLTLILAGIVGYVADELIGLPTPITSLLLLLAISPILGGYALSAKEGDLEGGIGFLFANLPLVGQFALRFTALTAAWGIIAALLGQWLLSIGAGDALGMGGGGGSFKALFSAFGLLALMVGSVFASVGSLIVATVSDDLKESFSTEWWFWVFFERKDDLPSFFASYIGGMVLFFILAVPFLLILTAIAFLTSFEAGMIMSGITYILPWAASPVLLGRLAGAFVHSYTGAESDNTIVVDKTAMQVAVKDEYDVANKVKEIESKATEDIVAALHDAETLREDHPNNAKLLAVVVRLQLSSGDRSAAVETAGRAIGCALASNLPKEAVEVYNALGDDKRKVRLRREEFLRFGRTLANKSLFEDAVWAYRMSVPKGGDSLKAEKGIMAAGEAAGRAGEPKMAVAIYSYLIKQFPHSEFVDYCKAQIKKIKG